MLDDDVLFHALGFLSAKDHIATTNVCHRFRRLTDLLYVGKERWKDLRECWGRSHARVKRQPRLPFGMGDAPYRHERDPRRVFTLSDMRGREWHMDDHVGVIVRAEHMHYSMLRYCSSYRLAGIYYYLPGVAHISLTPKRPRNAATVLRRDDANDKWWELVPEPPLTQDELNTIIDEAREDRDAAL